MRGAAREIAAVRGAPASAGFAPTSAQPHASDGEPRPPSSGCGVGVAGEAARMMRAESGVKLYARGGDGGETSLLGGTRVSKAERRVDAYGEVDELNAWLGLVRAHGPDAEIADALVQIQRD